MFPQINQRFFAADSKTVLKRTFALWPILVLLLFVPAFMLGTWASGLDVTVPDGGNVIPALLTAYTPGWFAALVVAGAMAAMMSSSDSMLLSGSSYFTRDLYRPFLADGNGASGEHADSGAGGNNEGDTTGGRREDLLARVGVAVFALLAFVASLFRPGTLIEIGDTAFSGFAQLALPVLVALYWSGTTRDGMFAGIIASQVFYLASVFLPMMPGTYGGWSASLVGMLISLVLTVSVSALTSPATEENERVYSEGLRAD